MPENRTGAIASETNRRLTKALESAGRARGFIVRSEYPVPGGRLDVVWCTDIVPPLPGVEDAVPVVAFEIEPSWRTRKHIKGDLLNILDAGAAIGVIVLAGTEGRDESLMRFARALVDRPGPRVYIWTADDVLHLDQPGGEGPELPGDVSPGEAIATATSWVKATVHTGKYRALWRWLCEVDRDEAHATFEEIEDRIGIPLPPSCRRHASHWSGYEGSAVARAIHDAGWRATRVDLAEEQVTFVRQGAPAPRT